MSLVYKKGVRFEKVRLDPRALNVIGRDPGDNEIKLYRIRGGKIISKESLGIKDSYISRFEPDIKKYGSIVLYKFGNEWVCVESPGTTNPVKV